MHKIAYSVGAAAPGNLPYVFGKGFIDFEHVTDNGVPGDPAVGAACAKQGMSYVINWTNDGFDFPGWSDAQVIAGYQQGVKNGAQAMGGESASAWHVGLAKGIVPFANYGGGGLIPPTDCYKSRFKYPCKSQVTIDWLETYEVSSMIAKQDMVNALISARDCGSKEPGLMIGSWAQADYGANAQYYVDVIDAAAQQGVIVSHVSVWGGRYGTADSVIQNTTAWQGIMQQFPADMRQLRDRIAGNPPPVIIVPDGDTPGSCYDTNGLLYEFHRGMDNQVYYRTPVMAWKSLGGIVTSGIAAACAGNDIYVFARGSDKETMYYRTLTQGWQNIGGICTSSPSAAATTGRVTVSVRGNDKAYYYKTLDLTTKLWGKWTVQGGVIN